MIPNNIFSSTPIPGGYSWTIASRAGHILRTAENKYGKRDISYTLLGIELTSEDNPQIWFPGNCGNIIIQITENCIYDMNRAIFQVAHEIIHCLCPKKLGSSTYLEEGLATYFSMEYLKENGLQMLYPSEKYQLASTLTEQLLSYDIDIIKNIRHKEPCISEISESMISEYNSQIPSDLIKKLTTNFSVTFE